MPTLALALVLAQQAMPPELLARVGDAIVRLSIEDGEERGSNGTGFVVRSDGIVVTNHHVVEGAGAEFFAVFRDGTRKKVVGSLALDADHDLAVLRIEPGKYRCSRWASLPTSASPCSSSAAAAGSTRAWESA